MTKIITGLLIILLAAGLLSGGVYLLTQIGAINKGLVGQFSNMSGLALAGIEGTTRNASGTIRQPLGDLPANAIQNSDFGLGIRFTDGLNGMLQNIFLIAGITMAVVLVEKVYSVFRTKNRPDKP
ncbi:MAG TPA: hypothetical protein VMC62_10100 [Longilinea sp.]|nr:hypothetical protein [Longilinea sp.]